MNKRSFSEIQNDEQLAEYLKGVLARPPREEKVLRHYTSFSSLQKIFESHVLLLNRPSRMNDKAEASIIAKKELTNKLFYCCFTLESEKAELWDMYTEIDNGCILEISWDLAKEMLDYDVLEFKDGLKKTGTKTAEKPSFSSIVYYSVKDSNPPKLACRSVSNDGYQNFYETSQIAGMAKSDFWSCENEVRLILNSDKEWPKDTILGLSLKQNFWKKCRVVISPLSTKKKENEIMCYCKRNSINCSLSTHSGQINFNNRLFNMLETKQWITHEFNSMWGIEDEIAKHQLTYGEMIAKIIIQKLNRVQVMSSPISECEDALLDEICSLFNDLDRGKVQIFVKEVIKYLEV